MDFKSADPSVVKSIRQRDLLNSWLRLYARRQCLPCYRDYQPDRFAEESSDLVHYTVESAGPSARFVIERLGSSMRQAYGSPGEGQDLDAFLGPRLGPVVMPIYLECARANEALPKPALLAVIDRNLFHSLPARGRGGGAIQLDWD